MNLARTMPLLLLPLVGPLLAADPSSQEQLMIYELNRARNNPARYQTENSGVVASDLSSVVSQAAGGWAIPVTAGAYTVTASGGAFSGVATAQVTVVNRNLEIDFRSGNSTGDKGCNKGVDTVTDLIVK